jgi:hypothetical protein
MNIRVYSIALGILLTACTDPAPTGVNPAVEKPSFTITNTNEPAGFTNIASLDGTTIPPATFGTVSGGTGKWYTTTGAPRLTVTTDASAPGSPDSVLDTKFPSGWSAGTSPVWFQGWEGSSQSNPTQYSKVYIHYWVKVGDSTGYENEPVGTKFGFLSYGQAPATGRNQGIMQLHGNGSTSVMTNIPLYFRQQGNVTGLYTPNTGGGSGNISTNVWHEIEWLFQINSAADSADGSLTVWVDGSKSHDYTNVVYMTAGNTKKFQWYMWQPVWGGNGAAVRSRIDHIQMDHLYISAQ